MSEILQKLSYAKTELEWTLTMFVRDKAVMLQHCIKVLKQNEESLKQKACLSIIAGLETY